MAIKKTELYSSLDRSTNKIRGGMDASMYKNYILTMLFLKYVTDKFLGRRYAPVIVPDDGNFEYIKKFCGKLNIGEEIDKAISKLAEANPSLTGLFADVHFNEDAKFGTGEEKAKKLTDLVKIFCRPEFDLRNNKASGDDILGDTYEYLMRKYAVEGGKSKGQFYTPGEASRVLAGLLGISGIKARAEGWSVYDPACGSASLLIRAASEASCPIAIYGQEMDITTAALAKMNLVLHNRATGEIATGNTFADPKFFDVVDGGQELKRFDFATVNPPFSLKNWKDGFKDFGRLAGFGAEPPEKNGDYAWLMHVIKSLKKNGRAAVILPLGVLFRGNAEETIRRSIIDRGWIEGIVAFPPNIFYGTGIPACVIVLDKAAAATRTGIFMIDASRDFVKDGDKNRLRERDIFKIVSTYRSRREEPHYSRFVMMPEIKQKNQYNLNIPRYIDSGLGEAVEDIDGHLNGGIPAADVKALSLYWEAFPKLLRKLFKKYRDGYSALAVEPAAIRETIMKDDDFAAYGEEVIRLFNAWRKVVLPALTGINANTNAKTFVKPLAEELLKRYDQLKLIDKYDVYEALLSYWVETMSDDLFAIAQDGFEAGREIMSVTKEVKNKKGEMETKDVGWDGKIIPRTVLDRVYFADTAEALKAAKAAEDAAKNALDEFNDGVTEEDDEDEVAEKRKELEAEKKKAAKKAKDLAAKLEKLEKEKYPTLRPDELQKLIIDEKWIASVRGRIDALFAVVGNQLAARVTELHERYAVTLGELDTEGAALEKTVAKHLKEMGY